MWSFVNHGLATAVVDFTSDFAVLWIGLIFAVALSGAMIAWSAIQHARDQERQAATSLQSHIEERRDAA